MRQLIKAYLSINPYIRKVGVICTFSAFYLLFFPERLQDQLLNDLCCCFKVNYFLSPNLDYVLFRIILGVIVLFTVTQLKNLFFYWFPNFIPNLNKKIKSCVTRQDPEIAAIRRSLFSKKEIKYSADLLYFSSFGMTLSIISANNCVVTINILFCLWFLLLYYWHIFNVPFVEFQKISATLKKEDFKTTPLSNFTFGDILFFKSTLLKRAPLSNLRDRCIEMTTNAGSRVFRAVKNRFSAPTPNIDLQQLAKEILKEQKLAEKGLESSVGDVLSKYGPPGIAFLAFLAQVKLGYDANENSKVANENSRLANENSQTANELTKEGLAIQRKTLDLAQKGASAEGASEVDRELIKLCKQNNDILSTTCENYCSRKLDMEEFENTRTYYQKIRGTNLYPGYPWKEQ